MNIRYLAPLRYHALATLWALLLLFASCIERKPERLTKRESPVTGELASMVRQLEAMPADTLLSQEVRIRQEMEFRRTIYQFLAQSLLVEPVDLYRASLVLYETSRPSETETLLLAHLLAMESARKGYDAARHLAAATLDRYLVRQGLAQKYGTQCDRDRFGRWFIPFFDTLTGDSERAIWGVPPLDSLKLLVSIKNK
ncbi:MAG: hypothetical protein AB1644_00740 [Candidatus Zixiibacteriota bacterium]